jgi:hypothetical protein
VIRAEGTSEKPIYLSNIGIFAWHKCNIWLDHCIMTNGNSLTVEPPAKFDAVDCTFGQMEGLSVRGITNTITRCVIVNWSECGQIRNLLMQNCLVISPSPTLNGKTFLYSPERSTFRGNSFLNSNMVVVRSGGSGSSTDFSNNYWGTTDVEAIEDRIIDGADTFELPNRVTYFPILFAADPATPKLDSEPPPPVGRPTVAIYSAVEVEFATEPLRTYLLEASDDLSNWQDVGPEFLGDGGPYRRTFRVGEFPFRYFRARLVH